MKHWYFCLVLTVLTKLRYCHKCILTDIHKPSTKTKCMDISICKRNYTIAAIDYQPYSSNRSLIHTLESCCGKCLTFHREILRNKSEITPDYLKTVDFIGPLAALKSTQYMYGFHYIPVIDAPTYVYITLPPKPYILRVLEHSQRAFPLFFIVLLMAIFSGFCSWLLETRWNSEEFPRPVFRGWFEGCWWSFVSMTTVGYGDKTPRTVLGRLYAVIWILFGITIFNILTGICTTALQSSLSPETPTLKGARVGVCQYRILDALLVANLDGIVVKTNGTSFKTEILLLASYLEEKKIDGILIDQITFNYIVHIVYPQFLKNDFNSFGSLKNYAKRNYSFLVNEAVTTKKAFSNNDYSFGVLVKDEDVYNFMHDPYSDNYITRNTNIRQKVNKALARRDQQSHFEAPFNIIIAVAILAGLVAFVFLLAIIINVYQRRAIAKRMGTN